jgi:hypothetical protein
MMMNPSAAEAAFVAEAGMAGLKTCPSETFVTV